MPSSVETTRAGLERLSPYLRSNLGWERAKRRGDLERRIADSLVGRGMVTADIGASAGEFTARFAYRVGRRGAVYCFEPLPEHRERLQRLASRRSQISFHPVALSDRAGEAELTVPVIRSRPKPGLATLRQVEGGNTVRVRTETLDRVLEGTERLDFVKCDVEGHEHSVLRGGEATIRRLKPTLMLEIEQRHLVDLEVGTVIGLVEDWGYTAEALFPTGLGPIRDFDLERDQLAFVEPGRSSMPEGYVNTFLFKPS